MTSTSNYGKLFRVKQHCMRGDRITILPDFLLIHILSFLPTKYAVKTCILSTRWKHIWASVPNLHFFFRGRHCSVFADFIDRVLFFHELPRIQRFSLECAGVDVNRLNTWVSVAVRRGVQELHIDVQYTSDCIILPPTLFTCTTLVVFKLRSLVQMEIPGLVRFPNLRVLHVSLQFPFGDMIQKLFCSCPVLEDFSIRGYIDNSQAMAFDISTVALKKLEIDFKDQGFEYSDNEFVINAPILEHLTLRDNYFALYRLKNLSSLFRADIDVGDGVGCIEIYGWKERANQVYELLKGISNVKYLTLGARTMGALDYADDNNLPLLFPNITHLKLRVSNSSSWKRLTYLLSCMPNLENLEVSTKKEFELHDHLNLAAEPNWIEPVPEQTPTCLLLHLKEIGLTGFTSKIYHLNLIKYLLENAKVLIKMAINTRNLAVEEEVEFLRHLVTCRRGALACTIELSRK